uniref:Fucosyltransferase n=1 Tax=Spodoptera frugiperda TaxID=7108 RepID=A0A2H1VN94_SPOFR
MIVKYFNFKTLFTKILNRNKIINRRSFKYFICIVILGIIYNNVVKVFTDLYKYHLEKQFNSSIKYILVWTPLSEEPICYLGEGRKAFIERGCPHTNCYVTENRKLLQNITEFHAIVFHLKDMRPVTFVRHSFKKWPFPRLRKSHQKYIFTSKESDKYYPLCYKKFQNFFNWTWTYKLNSDLSFNYIFVWDKDGNIIGPKQEMHWMKAEDMLPINDTLKEILNTKTIAAAWFVSNCRAPNRRSKIARKLQIELQKYDMRLDVFGACGKMKCPRSDMDVCLRKLRNDYYFYLAFENSFSVDYVSEKLLWALNNYVVPVVYGGANYTRFMPDGIYLSAMNVSVKELAKKMVNIIRDKSAYYEFFKWHNHYSFHSEWDSVETDHYCRFCTALSNEEKFKETSIYKDIGKWWSPHVCR